MHAISSYRGNRHRPPARPPATNTQTGPITIHCAASSRSVTMGPSRTVSEIKAIDKCIRFDTLPESEEQTDGRIYHNNIALCMHVHALALHAYTC